MPAQLWGGETGNPIGEPLTSHVGPMNSVSFSLDGERIVTASKDNTAPLWEIFADTQDLMTHARAAAPRCLTAAQRSTFFLPPEPPPWCIELDKWPYNTPEWKQRLSGIRAGRSPPLPHER